MVRERARSQRDTQVAVGRDTQRVWETVSPKPAETRLLFNKNKWKLNSTKQNSAQLAQRSRGGWRRLGSLLINKRYFNVFT